MDRNKAVKSAADDKRCIAEAKEYLEATEIEGMDIAFNPGEDIKTWSINKGLNAVSRLLNDLKDHHDALVAQVRLNRKLRTGADVQPLVTQISAAQDGVLYYSRLRHGLVLLLGKAGSDKSTEQDESRNSHKEVEEVLDDVVKR